MIVIVLLLIKDLLEALLPTLRLTLAVSYLLGIARLALFLFCSWLSEELASLPSALGLLLGFLPSFRAPCGLPAPASDSQ